jgi:cyclopropane-fatty-acyl-phospholipid synthase
MKSSEERTLSRLLALADVVLDGERDHDIRVRDDRFYGRVLRHGSLGLGEAYMDGWWDAPRVDELFARILGADLGRRARKDRKLWGRFLWQRLVNPQRRAKAFEVGQVHYDLGNDLFEAMLDRRMVYTCGYWKSAATLDEAQEAKLDLVCRKLGLKEGQHVLDIGCGWGSFLKYAAERYGVRGTGLTVSKEQVELGRRRCEGLPVEILLRDYREVDGRYDHVVSLGMFEHVGVKNYRTFMRVVERSLVPGGLFLLHTIGGNRPVRVTDPWISKYIFPNGMLPTAAQITRAVEEIFVLEDWHAFSLDYDRTLMAWHENFTHAWPRLNGRYDDRFYRMWTYYLLISAGSFRAHRNQLWQVVYSKGGFPGGYASVR